MGPLGDAVRKALDESFSEQVKGLYAAVWAKVTGGEPMEQAIKEFDRGLLLNLATVHATVLEEAEKIVAKLEENERR